MDFELCVQDPTDPDTEYLYEAILGAADGATTWLGLYAFATRNGVNQLINDPILCQFLAKGGTVQLIVGLDAITNLATLVRLQELARQHATFHPKVFWNETDGLFHPKLSYFTYADGSKTLIVGSGNLTPGGLMHNFEAYGVLNADPRERAKFDVLQAFLDRHHGDIRDIDQEALDRAALNVAKPGPRMPGSKGAPKAVPKLPVPAAAGVRAAIPLGRVLIAQVPAAGGRWAQVHFNKDVIKSYFRISKVETQRVYLTPVNSVGVRGEEEVRPCVYSKTNKNFKIEIAAAKGLHYPTGSVPILVLRERQIRVFDYLLLMPGDSGYAAALKLSTSLPSIGRGHPRVITDLRTLGGAWPGCPLLNVLAAEPTV